MHVSLQECLHFSAQETQRRALVCFGGVCGGADDGFSRGACGRWFLGQTR